MNSKQICVPKKHNICNTGLVTLVQARREGPRHWTKAGSMLGRRHRRRASFEPTLVQCLALK